MNGSHRSVQTMLNVVCAFAIWRAMTSSSGPGAVSYTQLAGAAVALVSAQIALAGIGNLVDFDQTVEAMRKVGRSLPFELRESALGGIAAAPTACAYCPDCACLLYTSRCV